MTRFVITLAALAGVVPYVHAQTDSSSRTLTPVRLQIVFEKFQGEKRLTSEPYTLSLVANDRVGASNNVPRTSRIRMGIDVPMRMDRANDKEVPGNVVYRSVGNAADCAASSIDDTRFKIDCTFEQSSISSDKSMVALVPPMLRTFRTEASVILRDNETTQYTSATDPVSGETLKVALTLSVVK